MANQRVSNTALGAATCRLIEQYQPENTRLFHDPLVKDLVPPIRALIQLMGRKQVVSEVERIALATVVRP